MPNTSPFYPSVGNLVSASNFPAPTTIVYYGPGGDYLSNEIFFRVALLRKYLNLDNVLKSGHLHVPILPVNDITQAKSEIINVKKIIGDAIQGL
jgi:hypothetical protein